MSKIFINKINLSNIACFETLEVVLGKITKVTGQNGTGKSSLVKGLTAGINSGNPVEIIRNGQEKAEVAIEFSNGMSLQKVIGKDGKAKTLLFDENGHVIPKPQTFLDKLLDAWSYNPVSIITASPKDRIKLLLEALPMKAEKEDFRSIFNGLVDTDQFANILNQHALDAIQTCYNNIYEKRTDVNSQLKRCNATTESLKGTMPKTDIQDVDNIITNNKVVLEELVIIKNKEIKAVSDRKQLELELMNDLYNKKLAELNDWKYNEKQNVNKKYDSQIYHYEKIYQQQSTPVKEELIRLQELQKNQAAYNRQKEIITQNETESKELKTKSDQFSESLKKLEALKSKFLSNIPVEGLNVENGIIYYQGIPYDSLNTQKQIEIACEIAKLRSGELGIVFIDGFERLDTIHQEAFIKQFAKTDLQLLVTEVTDSEKLIFDTK